MTIECTYTVNTSACWDRESLRRLFGGARNVAVTAHMNADGDAVGSVTAMFSLLSALTQASVVPMLPDGCPDDYRWLPHTDRILSGKDQSAECISVIEKADLIVCLDLSTLDRTGCLADTLRAAHGNKLLIDHHEHSAMAGRQSEFGTEVVDSKISSTCELVYWLIRDLYGPDTITPDVATSLFTGLCTDTGTFSYSNRDASLYLAAAELSQHGIDPTDINRRIKNVFTPARLRFFGHAMSELLTVYPEQGVALMTIREDDMRHFGVDSSELTGLVNEVMKLRDTDCAILIREEADRVRLSLRSKENHDVNQLAADLFGGGGHRRAAGATSRLSLADTLSKVKRHLGLAFAAIGIMLAASCHDVPVVDLQPASQTDLKESLIDANRHIAHSEETQIDAYVARRGWQMQRLPSGTRLMRTATTGGAPVGPEDTVRISYTLSDLGGRTLYTDVADTVVAGKLKPTRGLDAAILTLRHGDRARVVVPSEQAYGVLGDGQRITTRMVLVYDLRIE